MNKRHCIANIFGLILLPICIGATLAFTREIIREKWTPNLVYFFLGCAVYLFIHLFFHRPILEYVAGHELTHVLWGIFFGAKIKKIKVSKRGGSVAMSKANILVKLAPYIFPIYTFLVMGIYFIIKFFWSAPWLPRAAVFMIGITFSFHMVLLFYTLRTRQSDLNSAGFLLSTVFIYLANIFILVVIFTIISQCISLGSFFLSSADASKEIYRYIYNFFGDVIDTFKRTIGNK